jgi:hypothetical protein
MSDIDERIKTLPLSAVKDVQRKLSDAYNASKPKPGEYHLGYEHGLYAAMTMLHGMVQEAARFSPPPADVEGGKPRDADADAENLRRCPECERSIHVNCLGRFVQHHNAFGNVCGNTGRIADQQGATNG